MIITTNGNTDISTGPGRAYVFTIAGTFSAGTVTLLWKDQAGNYVAFDKCALTAAGKREVISPFNGIRITVSGAGTPSLYTDLVPCVAGENGALPIPGVAGSPSADVVSVQGFGFSSGVVIARPANTTTYAIGDAVGDANGSAILEFQNIGPSGGQIYITSGHLRIDIAAIPSGMTSLRLYLYDSAPDALADNAPWVISSTGDRGKFKGYIDLGTPVDLGATCFVQIDQINKQVGLATGSTSLFGILVTNGAIVPANNSEVYTVRLRSVGI
ncbi:MAG: hypothetical protein ABIP97_13855 [Chthoniobacterales bacterium]